MIHEPEENEICIFWNSSGYPMIARFKRMTDDLRYAVEFKHHWCTCGAIFSIYENCAKLEDGILKQIIEDNL